MRARYRPFRGPVVRPGSPTPPPSDRGSRGLVRRSCAALLLVLVFATSLAAQVRPAPRLATGPVPRAGTWEVGGGIAWLGGYDFGGQAAELTRNTTGNDRFLLFNSSSEVHSVTGVEGRLGVFLSPSLLVEGGVRYGRPIYAVDLSGDFEEAPPIVAEMTISHYLVDGSAVWHFTNASFGGGRGFPFVRGGVGYLRELLEGNELVETGLEYHGGAGFKYWLGAGRRRFGLRGEAGVSVRDGGFDFEDRPRLVPVLSGTLVYIF